MIRSRFKRRALATVAALSLLVPLVLYTSTPAGATVATATTSADAFVASDLPTTNENTTLLSQDGSPLRYSFAKFVVSVPAGETVTNATLRCWAGSANSSGVDWRTTTSSWSETTLTWNNAPMPNFGLPPSGSTGAVVSGQYNDANVTSAITGSGTYTFVGRTASSVQWSCLSKENSGNHPMQLVVTSSGSTDNPPVARLTVTPTSGTAPLAVNADASASTDTDATPISTYTFAWGDGSPNTGPQAGATAPHTYSAAGSYTVTVTATDTAGKTGTATQGVTVSAPVDNPPTAALTVTPSSGDFPLLVNADASASTDTDATPISTYTFAWGDGSANTGPQAGATATHTYATAGTFTVTVTVTDTGGLTGQATKTVTVTTPATHANTTLPARGAFYYPWYPETWGNINSPDTKYTPTLGFYDSSSVMASHIASLAYGNFAFAPASWWGQGSATDNRLGPLLTAAHGSTVKFAPYYEAEGNSIAGVPGSPNPAATQITSDLNYIASHYTQDPNYMWVNDKPVIFAFGDGTDGCGMADRWAAGNAAATTHFYIVLKVFAGYAACTNQPDNWHQYGPATRVDQQGTHSYSLSPGYFKYTDASPLLARDPANWPAAVNTMNCATADLKLVTTFNEWGEGTAVESASGANGWSSASGQGTYLDALHNNTTCGVVDNPPVATLTVTPSSGNVPLAVTADASASTDTDATPIASYTFNFGDGSAAVGPQPGATANHTYTVAGNYTVTVTVTDTASKTGTATKPVTATTGGGGGQHKVIMIMEENHSQAQANAGMPYLTGLGNQYGKATGYHGVIHPSLGNYISWAGGDSHGITDDNAPASHPIAGNSVFDQTIAAAKTAKTYAEGMTSNCMLTNTGRYVIKHNPWGYFNGATQRANCNANNVPMGTTTSGNLLTAINAGTLPVTGFMEPDLCNDAHDCSLATADTWLQGWIPKLMNGPDYTSGNLTIIVTFDEDDGSSGNLVAFAVIDPRLLNVHKVVSTSTNHYALTRWYDDNAGVSRLGNAATAIDLRTAFGL